jgi:hypothetical protein
MDTPDEIRCRMAVSQAQLHHGMSRVVEGASSAFDWQSFVKARPWTFLGLAFAAG